MSQEAWDVVRAAQHMREIHGKNAAATAQRRAENTTDAKVFARWRSIAVTIKELDGRS